MKDSAIEWTDHTFNFWEGCTKVSPGCTNCYAEARNKRFHDGENWGKGAPRLLRSEAYRKDPLKWEAIAAKGRFRQCPECGWRGEVPTDEMDCPNGCDSAGLDMFCVRPRVFSASLSDWLDDEVPIEWLADLLKLVHDTPNLDWLLLTKRPDNWRARVGLANDKMKLGSPERIWSTAWAANKIPRANIWIGTTVEDQQRAEERIPALLKIPAHIRFLSCEPLLEEVALLDTATGWPFFDTQGNPQLHWIICGGESGSNKRTFDPDWARLIQQQCAVNEVAFFMKQWDKVQSVPNDLLIRQFPKAS